MILLISLLVVFFIPVFWNIVARLTHFSHEKALAYKNDELSKIERFKIDFHLAMCFECQSLIEKPKEKLPLEDHLIDPKK